MVNIDLERSNAFASGMYRGVQVVAAYMHDRAAPLVDGVLPKPDVGHRDASMKGLWLRARGWVQTLERLDETKYVQAISTANRALLEITTDLIVLHHDKTNESGWKLHWWGVSEKMKAAEQTVRFYEDQGLVVPDEYSDLEEFYRNEKQIVDDMRRTLWPVRNNPGKAEHPKRWTGKSDLSVDVERADELHGVVIRADLGKGLVEYYRTEYRKMNWQIHSGTAGWWDPLSNWFLMNMTLLFSSWVVRLTRHYPPSVMDNHAFGRIIQTQIITLSRTLVRRFLNSTSARVELRLP